jgi:hypothetical protein
MLALPSSSAVILAKVQNFASTFHSSERDIVEELQNGGSLGLKLLSEFEHVRIGK